MAKQSQAKSASASRIRFIMLDAEIPEGDLSQITLAIQNALKPSPIVNMRAIAAPHQTSPTTAPGAEQTDLFEEEVEFDEATAEDDLDVSKTSGPPRQRKIYTPKVLELDLTTDVSFEDFANRKSVKTDVDKYLVIAAWFKEHRQTESIGADHVYTCYRAMKWPTTISDFGSPLRKLKSQQIMLKAGAGLYQINHLGLERVRKMSVGE